jgi:hypothetical protein
MKRAKTYIYFLPLLTLLLFGTGSAWSQIESSSDTDVQQLRQMVLDLEHRVAVLEQEDHRLQTHSVAPADTAGTETAAALVLASEDLRSSSAASPSSSSSALPIQETVAGQAPVPAPLLPGTLLGGATLNYLFDGYYEYNFNSPAGRANDLRAYDVLSNSFSINQADLIFDLEPDLTVQRRWGFRTDLQFGQATASQQGNPGNETRPDVYRNLFQLYGSYIVPLGHGLDIDFGKWASSLGIEGNYTKDQMNYSRSFYFTFLPYYHMGLRASYRINDRMTANYWLVNGTQQSEDVNGSKDQLGGLVLTPAKSVSWILNYYNGQEHPDSVAATDCAVPLQPWLCTASLSPAPDGRLHILDSYATWTATTKLTLGGEGDYVISREWATAAPGQSSAPSHVDGGAAYLQYQLRPRIALAGRTEYLSDRGGLFSNQTQALKEITGTYKYALSDNFDAFVEYRHDWSNRPYFITDHPASPSTHQDTALLGLVWWYGGKQGSW